MKTAITMLMLLCSLTGYCQLTTQNEYNYMKKGYREVEEKGIDVKKGYTVEVLATQEKSDITATYTLLKRNDNSIAGIIIKTVADYSGTNYYAMPAVNQVETKSYGWADFYKDLNTMTGGQKSAVMEWISYRLAYVMSQNNRK